MYTKGVIAFVAFAIVSALVAIGIYFYWKQSTPPRLTPVWGWSSTLSGQSVCVWYKYPLDYSGTAGLHPAPVAGTDFQRVFIGVNERQVTAQFPVDAGQPALSHVSNFSVSDGYREFSFVRGAPASGSATLADYPGYPAYYELTVSENNHVTMQAQLIADCGMFSR